MEPRSFLIVGGSSGIGWEIVNQLENEGYEIYLASRTRDKPANLKGVQHVAEKLQSRTRSQAIQSFSAARA